MELLIVFLVPVLFALAGFIGFKLALHHGLKHKLLRLVDEDRVISELQKQAKS